MSQRAGWYDDPDDASQLRYFDGILWTQHRQPKKSPTAERSTIGHAQPPVAPQQPAYGQQQPTYGQQPPYGAPPQQPPQGQQGYGYPPQGYGYGAPYGPQGYVGVGVRTTPDGAVLAGWGRRLGAYLLDNIVVGIVSSLLALPWLRQVYDVYVAFIDQAVRAADAGQQYTPDTAALMEQVSSAIYPIALINLLVWVVYQVAFLLWRGGTPGKLLLGMRVRRRDRPGRLDVATVTRRVALPVGLNLLALAPFIGYLTGIVNLLDYLWPLWDDKNQALHDKVAGTNVVMAQPEHR